LEFFSKNDIRDGLFWNVIGGVPKFYAECSDMFMWGCADLEEITPENFHILEQSLVDVLATENFAFYSTYLFACRVRKQRPMKRWFEHKKDADDFQKLFDDCGPPIVSY
jgi:hypothetical protein